MNPRSNNPVTFFALSTFRREFKPVGLRRSDRLFHMYIVGKTGTGKSTLMRAMLEQDLRRGEGLALLDPHGDLARAGL